MLLSYVLDLGFAYIFIPGLCNPLEMSKMVTIGRKGRILTALALVTVVLSTIGYAHIQLGMFIVTTKEIATVSVDNMDLGTLPQKSAGTKTFSDAINITFDDAFEAGTEVTIKAELVIWDSDVYRGFRALVILVKDSGGGTKAVLTLNSPYAEFDYTIETAGETKLYDVKVNYATGCTTLTGVTFQLSVDIQA